MGSAQDDEEPGAFPELLLKIVRNPSLGKRWLPQLLGFLGSDDVRHRITASWAVCLVAVSDEEMLDYAVRRLVDRLDEDSPVEIKHTLDYLAAHDPRGVDDVLVDLDEEAEVRARRLMYQTGGGFARNEYVAQGGGERDGGLTRVATGSENDPRQLYTEDEPSGEATPEVGEDDAEDDQTSGEGGPAGGEGETRLTRGRIAHISERLSGIVADSRFDDLDLLSERDRRRYADVHRTVATVGGAQEAVALALFRLPDERESFVREFDATMGYWSDVDDHETVLTLYDWGWNPHPWAATEYTNVSLSDRSRLDPRSAVENAVDLAAAVAHAQQHGVVHAAIDPTNVVYYGTALTEDETWDPLLSNVGLTPLYRDYVEPESVLDPRYAAPEYYDEGYGGVDHATDVYGLGVVLYRLCTGHPPYTGSLASVREQVLSEPVPAPSTVVDVPAEIDQIVGKATAKRKLRRYETVTHLERELRTLGGIDAG